MSALIAMVAISIKMSNNNETQILMTSGKSISSISLPFISFATIVTSIVLCFQCYVAPRSLQNYDSLREQIQGKISMSIMKPKVFNVVGNSVVYFGKITKDSIENILISHISQNKELYCNIITAKVGQYIVDDNRLFIKLCNGYLQKLDKNNSVLSTLQFKNFSYDVTQFVKKYFEKSDKPYTKTQGELLVNIKNAENEKQKNACTAEFHKRLTAPFALIINALIVALFMLSPTFRRRKNSSIFRSFAYSALCQILLITSSNASFEHNFLIIANYIFILATIITLSTLLVRGRALS
jgi:lipopolysaccharide export LptBFGC system permease protein LptF